MGLESSLESRLRPSRRILELPPYIFSELNALKADAQKRGISLMSLAIGDPDRPTPEAIVRKLQEAAAKPQNHLYSPYEGTAAFRTAIKEWFQGRFGVELDANREIVSLIGSKEGIAHFPVAFCDPGDKALYPSPGYPVFETCIRLADGIPVPLAHRPENGFLPDLNELESLLKEHKPKFMILNYPSNPTTAVASRSLLEGIVTLARRYETIIVYDNAYSEIYFSEADRPLSILQIPGAKEIAIEFHSLSKSFNMTGWRLGFAVGNPVLVNGLLRAKTNIDSGPLLAVQEAGAFALANSEELSGEIRRVYSERRETTLAGLRRLGIEYFDPRATFFIWAKVPGGKPSMTFTKELIESEGLVVTPGMGFGKEGESFFRLAMTVPTSRIEEAMGRLERYLSKQ